MKSKLKLVNDIKTAIWDQWGYEKSEHCLTFVRSLSNMSWKLSMLQSVVNSYFADEAAMRQHIFIVESTKIIKAGIFNIFIC